MHRVFIVSPNLMFGYGLKSLLSQENNIEIIGQESDTRQALQEIQASQPDTVIIDTSRSLKQGYSNFTQALTGHSPSIKVILVSLDNNKIHVVQSRQWVASGVADLIDAIGGIFSAEAKTSAPNAR